MKFDGDRLNEIVDLMLETVCTRRKTIRIAGDDYPAELVKAKFMKLDAEHIRFDLASYYGGLHCGDADESAARGNLSLQYQSHIPRQGQVRCCRRLSGGRKNYK